jgi:hypothetical protein
MTNPVRGSRRLNTRKSRAHTLVELVTAMVVGLLAAAATMSIFVASSKMGVEAGYRSRAENEVRIIVDNLTTDVRSAVAIESAFDGCGETFTSNSTTLILKLPAIYPSGVPIDVQSVFDRVIYHSNNGNPPDILRTVCPDISSARQAGSRNLGSSARPQLRISGAYQVQPDALSSSIVHYEFTAARRHGEREYSRPLAGSIRLRNRI